MYPQGVCRIRKQAPTDNGYIIFPLLKPHIRRKHLLLSRRRFFQGSLNTPTGESFQVVLGWHYTKKLPQQGASSGFRTRPGKLRKIVCGWAHLPTVYGFFRESPVSKKSITTVFDFIPLFMPTLK